MYMSKKTIVELPTVLLDLNRSIINVLIMAKSYFSDKIIFKIFE
jgi:hypothetical protein